MLAFSSFPIALCLLMRSTAALNIEITCPASGFKVGETATVTCEVNKTAFAGHCKKPASFIIFYFTPSVGARSVWCSTAFKGCDNTGISQVACGKCNCGCEKANDTFTFHRLDFFPILAHAAGNFSCEVICAHQESLPPLVENNCNQVTVEPLPEEFNTGGSAPLPEKSSTGGSAPSSDGSRAGRSGAMLWFILALSGVALECFEFLT